MRFFFEGLEKNILPVHAVGGRQDVVGRHQGTPTELGLAYMLAVEAYLVGVGVGLGLIAPYDPLIRDVDFRVRIDEGLVDSWILTLSR